MQEKNTIQDLLDQAVQILNKKENPRLQTEIILAWILKESRIYLHTYQNSPVSAKNTKTFYNCIRRIKKNEPLAYVINNKSFMSLEFYVNPTVLIPRSETELLVEKGLELAKGKNKTKVIFADIGTGSGAIAVSIAKYLNESIVCGIDNSKSALKIAKKNSTKNKVSKKCIFLHGNLLEPLKTKVDIIISNPPYIPTKEIKKLDRHIKDFEPVKALDGGSDGMRYIKKLIKTTHTKLNSGGHLLIEVGLGQAKKAKKLLLKTKKFTEIKIFKDYSGKERIVSAKLK